jgi:hypothetical protein
MARSGSPQPALYSTENIKNLPIAMLCGKEDMIASPEDYLKLRETLKQ